MVSPAETAPTDTLERIAEHLRYLGYAVEPMTDNGVVIARHAAKMNLVIRARFGGILITTLNTGHETARTDRAAYLSYINSLNRKARVVRFYADDSGDLYMEAWHPDWYDRAQFGVFLETWERDTTTLLFEFEEETTKYLK
jgi:hypothetical protein